MSTNLSSCDEGNFGGDGGRGMSSAGDFGRGMSSVFGERDVRDPESRRRFASGGVVMRLARGGAGVSYLYLQVFHKI